MTEFHSQILASLAAIIILVQEGSSPRPVQSQDSRNAIRAVIVRLQEAVRTEDRRAAATQILFPLEIKKVPLGVTSVPSVKVFMVVYPQVFTKKLRDALMRQNPDSIVVVRGTATIADGRIVIGFRCESPESSSCRTGVTEVIPYRKD
jgi:hypothetical protein